MGYKKPPALHRFRKGQSGNPLGRPSTLKRNAIEIVEYLFIITTQETKLSRKTIQKIRKIHKVLKKISEKKII